MADNGKMSSKRPSGLTKTEMREMLAQAVRNTDPELNNVEHVPAKKRAGKDHKGRA